jgi:hypothetical protein
MMTKKTGIIVGRKKLKDIEKIKVRWQKYFKIMVKLAETILRSTKPSIAYSPCYSIVLMCYNSQIDEIYTLIINKLRFIF